MFPLLIPILAQIGTPILKKLLEQNVSGDIAGTIVNTIAGKLGVPPTPEAINDKYLTNPAAVAEAAKAAEKENADKWLEYLAPTMASRDALLAREDGHDTFFAWGWRPAMSWLVIFLFAWSMVVIPLINAALRASIPIPSSDSILQFAGIWLVIYGGGHTIKSVFGK